jgi:hypothetical protein
MSGGSPRLPLATFPALKYPEIVPELQKIPLEEGKLAADRGFFSSLLDNPKSGSWIERQT